MGEGQVIPSHYRITSMRKETMPLWGIEFKPEHDGGEADRGGRMQQEQPPPHPNPMPDGWEPALESHMGTQGATESW